MLNKIACSYYNAAAISEEEDLYIWGSINSGLFDPGKGKAQEIPRKFSFDELNPFFKALQISLGPNHAAVLVGNKFLNKTEPVNYIDPIHQSILKKQAEYITNSEIDPIVEYNLAKNTYVAKEEFLRILNSFECEYTEREEEEISSSNFVDFFVSKNGVHVNLIQFFYLLNKDLFTSNRVITWGISENGRLGHGKPDGLPRSATITKAKDSLLDVETSLSNPETLAMIKRSYQPPDFVSIPTAIKKVCCGHQFTIALDELGTVWSWGKGSNGCLGTGELEDCWEPRSIPRKNFSGNATEQSIVDIAAGSEHCMAFNQCNHIFSWGTGRMGRLGHGNETSCLVPTKISFFAHKNVKVKSIACGELHSAAIVDNYEVYTWGCGANFRLGHGSSNNELIPRLVMVIAELYTKQISLGASHSLCVTTDGNVYSWGSGKNGRLGIDMVSDKDYLVPTRVGLVNESFKKKEFEEICAGPFQTFAVTHDGELFVWGSKKFWTLGLIDLKRDVYFPASVEYIKCYHKTKKEKGKKKTGAAGRSSLPIGGVEFDAYDLHFQDEIHPTFDPFHVAKVISGESNTAFLMCNGDLYIAGSGNHGQLGLNPESEKEDVDDLDVGTNLFWQADLFYSYTPLYMSINLTVKFKHIAVGLNHIAAIDSQGNAYSWGGNSQGQLGIGTVTKFVNKPTLIEEIVLKEFKMCIASHTYSAFLSVDGEIFVCGTSEYGCLGINNLKQNYDVLTPKLINDIPPIKFLAGAPQHMVAITTENDVMVWGNHNNGRIGLGPKNEKVLTPKAVKITNAQGPVKFRQASCGFMHTLLLDVEGQIWGAGARAYAGFPSDDGYRSLEDQDIFKPLPDLMRIKFIQISSGEFHNLALTEDNTVYGWGKSEYGKLAQDTFLSFGSPDNKLQNIILPKKIEDLENITEVSCGVNHSACLNDEGDVFIWGCTLSGRLGIAREDLRLLKHQRQVKAERNVLVLSTPKSLQTYFSDEFDHKIRLYTKESKKDFLGLQQGVSKIASQLLKAIDEAHQAEIEKDKPENDTYANAETRKLLSKKSQDKSPVSAKRKGLLALYENSLSSGLLNNATRATTSEMTAKRWLSPDTADVYHDSPLLSETNKIKPFNPPHASRFSLTVQPVETTTSLSAKRKNSSPRKSPTGAVSTVSIPKRGSIERRTIGNNASFMHLNFEDEKVENSRGQLLFQYFLQEEESDHFEITLNARDLDISESFERVFTKVSQVIDRIKKGMSSVVLETGSMIETSFEISEEKPQKIKNLAHTIPSFILQNIQIYEGIVSMMFLHPCYFHKMLKSELIDPNMVMDWAFKIYGTHNEDDRVINHMLALGLMILEDEVEQYPIHQQGVVKMRSHFVKVYNFIQSQQRENMNFIKEIVQYLLINVVIKDYYPGFNAARNRDFEGLIQSPQNEDDPLLTGDFIDEIELEKYDNEPIDELFDLEYYIKHRDEGNKPKGQRVMRRCLAFIKKFELFIKSVLSRPDFSVMGKISPQLRYFAARIYNEYKNTVKIDPFDSRGGQGNEASAVTKRTEFFLIDLFFGKVADVLFNYKDYGIRIPKEYQDILSPQNLSGLALVITKYLEKEQISTGQFFAPINDYISVNSKSTFIVNPLVRGLVNHDDYDLTFDNILRTLDDSMKIKDRYVSKLSVKDIINLQNFLIRNRGKMQIFIRGADDPISIMTEYIKDNHLDLGSFAFEMLEYRVNLKIISNVMEKQIGVDNLKIHRCNFCQLIFPEYLLRVEDVNLVKENGWACHNPKCGGRRNSYSKQVCDACGSLVQEYKYQRNFIFKRYLPLIKKEKSLQAYFQFIKGANKINENSDLSGLIKDKIELSIKQELFELAGLYSHMLATFERFDFKTLTKDYKMNLQPFLPEDGVNKAISILNDIFCDEFQIRKAHKRYLDRLDSLLVRLNQLVVNEDHKFGKIAKSIEKIGLEVALTKGKYNGVNSRILNKAGQAEEEEMMRRVNSDSVKPYNMFNSEDLKEQKVLANFLLHGKSVPKIVNNLKFNIFYRPEIGFNIKIVFVEDSWRNLLVRFVQRLYTNEVALEEVQISPQHFLELKRTSNYKAETTIGYATFYVENLVNLLNSVLTKSNTRKIGYDPSREKARRKEKEKKEKMIAKAAKK